MQASIDQLADLGYMPAHIREMVENKVPYNEQKMLEALSTPGVKEVKVAPLQPGDFIMQDGKKYKVIRINDKGEPVLEEMPIPAHLKVLRGAK
ncbi:MAG TPA: hypothetical protein VHO03_16665 [Ignavibacteriales bacterium]|nr:hypothetical protein [Ignavibacteriales bacterium]